MAPRVFRFDLATQKLSTQDLPAPPWTSWTYPLIFEEEVQLSHAVVGGYLLGGFADELDLTQVLTGGDLQTYALGAYADWPVESVDLAHAVTGGAVVQYALGAYGNWPVESVDLAHAATGGTLTTVLIPYSNWPVESIDLTHALVSGVLT